MMDKKQIVIKKLVKNIKTIKHELEEYKSFCLRFPDIIYKLDPKGKIIYINDAVEKYGYKAHLLLGKTMLEFIHTQDYQEAFRRINEKRREARSGTYPLEIRLITGDKVKISSEYQTAGFFFPIMEIDAYGLYDGQGPCLGNFIGTQGVARDITKRKFLEKTLQKRMNS